MYRQPVQFPHPESTLTYTALSVAATPVSLGITAPADPNTAVAITGWSFLFGTAFTGPYTLYLRRDSATGPVITTLGIQHSSSAVNLFYPIICPAGHSVYATVSLTTTGHTCGISLIYYHTEGQA